MTVLTATVSCNLSPRTSTETEQIDPIGDQALEPPEAQHSHRYHSKQGASYEASSIHRARVPPVIKGPWKLEHLF